jgi:pyrroloquinoline quinone (PQQ) biosynthesis protein C
MRGKESVKTNREQFREAAKSLSNYFKGKTQDNKKAKEATKIVGKYVRTREMEIRVRKKKLRKKGIKIPSVSSLISQELKKIEKGRR